MFGFSNKDDDNKMDLEKQIESILFYRGEEISLSVLKKALLKKESLIKSSIKLLKKRLEETSSLTIIENEGKYLLTTNKEYSKLINQIKAEEQFGELSSSALETLSIVLYKGPISKTEIEQIRGVNSSYILRNLLIRGLIEKRNINGKITYLKTTDLMRYLGITTKEELPAFEKVVNKLDEIEKEEDIKLPENKMDSEKKDNSNTVSELNNKEK